MEIWEPVGDILGNVTGGARGAVGSVGGVLGFAEGGVVPGPAGQPRAAIVHGGEGIFSVDMMRRLSMGPDALAPAFAPPAPAFGGGGRTVTVGDIDITVHVGADADECGRNRHYHQAGIARPDRGYGGRLPTARL